jgi:tetratricopeptide (TPR) repeat protein
MITKQVALSCCALLLTAVSAIGQTNPQDPNYKPGVTFQSANPNYMIRNPFYFEGRIDWNLLQITNPSDAWEYAQRGIHEQDDLLDTTDAIADYQKSISMNNLANGTCQLITTATGLGANTNPPPCMFTVRLRLGNLMKEVDPPSAVELFQEVLTIDPLRLGVNALIGEAYTNIAAASTDPGAQAAAYNNAIAAYEAELALSPVTQTTIALTGDLANNAHVHWALAEIYRQTGQAANEASELALYLQATQWHSDTYEWHIQLANVRLKALQAHAAKTNSEPRL